MDIAEAIKQRKSIRDFKSDPVPKEILTQILTEAQRAPSWANTQPWEFIVAAGSPLKNIREAFLKRAGDGEMMNPDLAGPVQFPEPFNSRRRGVGRGLFEVMGIGREDKERRMQWGLEGMKIFDAPCVIFITTEWAFYDQEEGLNVWPVFDCGLAAQNIMLLAVKHGLGTIPAIQAVAYPDVLRSELSIPDEKLIVLGIGIGYPDLDQPVNKFSSDRESLDSITTWCGFD